MMAYCGTIKSMISPWNASYRTKFQLCVCEFVSGDFSKDNTVSAMADVSTSMVC